MKRWRAILRWSAATVAAVVIIVAMLLWLAGTFTHKISPDDGIAALAAPLGGRPVVTVMARTQPYAEWAVGTTRAVHETTVGSRLLARVIAVHVRAGQIVEKDAILVELDDADLRAQVAQAEAVVAAASAALDQAHIEFERIKGLRAQAAASELELTRATNALRGAEAEKERAEEARAGAETRLQYAAVRAPMAGRVVDKRVDVGDTASPGQPLVSLYDHTRMQLVAVVRESLAQRLTLGQIVTVRLEALEKECDGVVEEIVPQAAAVSRSFEVKVAGPCPPDVFPGMFGRVKIPLDPEEVVLIPAVAVRHVGQLDLVEVVAAAEDAGMPSAGHVAAGVPPAGGDEYTSRRLVRLGRVFADEVEVLSGLAVGERVALPAAASKIRSGNDGN